MNEEEVPHQLDWLFTAEEPPEHQVEPENTIQEVHDEPEILYRKCMMSQKTLHRKYKRKHSTNQSSLDGDVLLRTLPTNSANRAYQRGALHLHSPDQWFFLRFRL